MPPVLSCSSLGLAGTDVPVIRVTGTAPGPRLTVLAGIHGCEYAPMAAVREWSRQLAGRDLHGTVVAAPVVNMPAFRARSPFVVPEDGKNLNRCFPGDPAGTLAQRLAHAVFTELIEGSDAVVDAHAGDMVEALEPFCLYDAGPAEASARDLAAAYGLGYVIRQEPGPDRAVGGTTSSAAAEIGIPAIIAEAGGCGLVTREAVAAHLRGRGTSRPRPALRPAAACPPQPVYLAAQHARGLVGGRCLGRAAGHQGTAARYRLQPRRGTPARGRHRPGRRRSAVPDDLARRGCRRPAARARRPLGAPGGRRTP